MPRLLEGLLLDSKNSEIHSAFPRKANQQLFFSQKIRYYRVIILSDNYELLLPVGSFIVLSQPPTSALE
jgi:hypothetical protein